LSGDNYESFIGTVKRLSPQLDSVRISNIYIRYNQNVDTRQSYPFGRAVLAEVQEDLLSEVVLNNTSVLEGGAT
jgi:hypothetical protein